MSRPAKFRFFTCPSCAALYQVVKAEAGPETGTSELACLVCGGNPIEQAFAKIKHWMRSAQKLNDRRCLATASAAWSKPSIPPNATTTSSTPDTLPSKNETL